MKQIAIKENHLYVKAYQKGKRSICRNVTVFVLKDWAAKRISREDPMKREHNRVGIATPKKIGGAVERNRARRLIREAYRILESEKKLCHGYLVVISAREGAPDAKMQDIKKELSYAFGKLGMYEK